MKQEIEKEAKRYAKSISKNDTYKKYLSEAFIVAVNSNLSERIKINYTIGILHELIKERHGKN